MMIDWVNVALNALWILGLSIILAAFSYHQWLAGETASRLRELWSQPSWQIPFSEIGRASCRERVCQYV